MEREVGGGIGMGNTCKPLAVSFQCMTKSTTNKKNKLKKKKELGMETHSGEGVMKEEKFPNSRKPSHWQVCGEFWNLRGQHNGQGKTKTHRTCT